MVGSSPSAAVLGQFTLDEDADATLRLQRRATFIRRGGAGQFARLVAALPHRGSAKAGFSGAARVLVPMPTGEDITAYMLSMLRCESAGQFSAENRIDVPFRVGLSRTE